MPAFSLNDRADLVNTTSQDLGGGHGTGAGELWSVTGNILYHRLSAGNAWVSTQSVTGNAVTRVDGALANQAVYISGNNVYFFNGVANTTTLIYNRASYSNINAVDVAWGNGYIVITRSDGSMWRNNSTAAPYGTAWTVTYAANTLGATSTVDINHNTGRMAFTRGTTSIDSATITGASVVAMTGSATDVCFADNGMVLTIIGGTINRRVGTAWTSDPTGPSIAKSVTGGPGGQAWCITTWTYNPNTIYTRSVDGSASIRWIDDQRVRTTYDNNAIMIPVTAGTYTLTETRPASWDILGILIYDPTDNSTGNPATNSATLNVAAGEVVHVIVQNERLVPVVLQKQCAGAQMIENFGSAPSTAAYVATAPVGISGYHYFASQRFDDGYYSVANNSVNWPNGSLLDHTTGTALGCYMLVNASFQENEFYRKRVTNLVPGVLYSINFWAASLSGGLNSLITVGVSDSNAVVLNTFSTPGFNGSAYYNWSSYSFTFTASTSQADIYLRNGGPGGNGNDLALDDITITPLVTPIQSLSAPSTLCAGTTSTLTATPTGGVWSSGNTTVATINSSSGVMSAITGGSVYINYTFTNAIGCITDTALLININAKPLVISSAAKTTVCRSETINLSSSASGGTTPYAGYSWTTLGAGNLTGPTNTSTATAVQSAAGSYNYIIAVTDANGCIGRDTATVAVTSNQSPIVTVNQSSTSLCGTGQTVNLSSSVSAGTAPLTYTWAASAAAGGLNTPVNQATASATPTQNGSYTYFLTVTDASGCKGSDTTAVIKASLGLAVTTATSNPRLCNNQSLTISSTPSGGITPYTYAWTGSPSGANITSASNIQNITAKPTVAGSYTYAVVVTDANNCTVTASSTAAVTLSTLTPPTITAGVSATTACNGQTTLTLTANRTNSTITNYNYVWTGSGLITSSYTNNTATTTTTTAKPTIDGSYSVTITNGNNCSATATTQPVTINPLPSVAPTATYLSSNLCLGQNITLASNPSGGTGAFSSWTYSWTQSAGGGVLITNTQNTTASPLTGGTYTYNVSATDTRGCVSSSSTAPVTVTVSSFGVPAVNASVSTASACSGQSTITLTATRTNSTAQDYSYVWSGSGVVTPTYTNNSTTTTTTAVPTANGNYTVRVTDGNNCTGTASSAQITVKPVPAIAASNNNKLCLGNTLNLLSTPNGGTSPYTYLWTASATAAGLQATATQNSTAKPTATGTYSFNIKVTDNNGCIANAGTGNVSVVPAVSATASASATFVCTANNSITLTSTPSGGTSPYTYSWTGSSGSGLSTTTNTQQNTSANPTTDGSSYAVLVIDNNGCFASAFTSNVTVRTSPSISATLTAPAQPICAGTTVSLSSAASGGSGSYTGFLWSGPGINSGNQALQNPSNVLPTASGTYSVTVSDANGCTRTASTAPLSVDDPVALVTIDCYSNYAQLTEYGGSAVSWVWSSTNPSAVYRPGNTVQNPTTIYNGTHKVVITDALGCKDSAVILNSQTSCSILPVGFESFTAVKKEGHAFLTWKTSYEINNHHFDVERSIDGKNWVKAGTVHAANNTNGTTYHFEDGSPFSGLNYYRLKQVDKDGMFSYSTIVLLEFAGEWRLAVYPNPVLGQSGLLQIKSNYSVAQVTVFNAVGDAVYKYRGNNSMDYNPRLQLSPLAAGVYYVHIKEASGAVRVVKIIK